MRQAHNGESPAESKKTSNAEPKLADEAAERFADLFLQQCIRSRQGNENRSDRDGCPDRK